MTTATYEIIESRDVSTGVAKRVNVSLVVAPDTDPADAIRDAAKEAQRNRQDVAFVFAYADRAEVGTAMPLARGRWVRKGAKGVVLVPWRGAIETLHEPGRKGVLDIAIEREVW